MSAEWWPNTLEWLEIGVPWLWIMFNVLQFPRIGRNGLWALAWGCSLCALLHIAGIGVVEVDKGIEGRSTVFGENANVVGATYAITIIALVGIGMFRDVKPLSRFLLLPLIGLIGTAMAKTGSRTAILVLAMGIAVLAFYGRSFGSLSKRIGTLLLIGTVLVGIIWQIPTVMKRFEKLDSTKLQQQEARVRMIPVLWEMFRRSPIYGSGPVEYQFELTRRTMPYLIKEQRTITAHNLVLFLLVETGIIGLLLFSAGVRGALVSAWRARLKPCGSLPLALIFPLIVAGMIVSNPSHHLVFWMALGYALAAAA